MRYYITMQLITDIKKKKELADLSEKFVREHVEKYLKLNPKAKKFLDSEYSVRSTKYKQIVKEIRAVLRRSYGLFRKDDGELEKLVSLLKTKRDKNEILKEILQLHSSTKERLPFYDKLYKRIFRITGKPSTILDLGCGLNPFSVKYMKFNGHYYAYDLSEKEVEMINKFFWIMKYKGKAEVVDIMKGKFPKSDVAFLFKMTDVIDKGKGHKKTEEILKSIPASYIVISFPTVTMSNKRMNFPRRKWVELLCERLGYSLKYFELGNELFYVIKK